MAAPPQFGVPGDTASHASEVKAIKMVNHFGNTFCQNWGEVRRGLSFGPCLCTWLWVKNKKNRREARSSGINKPLQDSQVGTLSLCFGLCPERQNCPSREGDLGWLRVLRLLSAGRGQVLKAAEWGKMRTPHYTRLGQRRSTLPYLQSFSARGWKPWASRSRVGHPGGVVWGQ